MMKLHNAMSGLNGLLSIGSLLLSIEILELMSVDLFTDREDIIVGIQWPYS